MKKCDININSNKRKHVIVLTLHGIYSELLPREILENPATQKYTISPSLFNKTIEIASKFKCVTISELSKLCTDSEIVLTFDDGLITDYEIAFPALANKDIPATFFVSVGNIGKNGYCNKKQLREMLENGMEIGSHGWTHEYLTNMSEKQVYKEIVNSKLWLEQELATEIQSYAPVGGHYRKWMKTLSFNHGYKSFVTMVPGTVPSKHQLSKIKRNHLQAQYTENDVLKLFNQEKLIILKNKLRYYSLIAPKIILGMQTYDRLKQHVQNIKTR